MRRLCIFLGIIAIFLATSISCASKSKESPNTKGGVSVVEDGRMVSIHYTLSIDGNVVESTQGSAPLLYKQGSNQIIPGLAKQLEGLHVGDKKSVTVSPQEGYGQLNPNAFFEVPRSSMPAGAEPKVGMSLRATAPDGRDYRAVISEVKQDTIVLNFNHPLAGKTLNFDIEVVSID